MTFAENGNRLGDKETRAMWCRERKEWKMKKGTRFRVIGPLNNFDKDRDIRIGDTGTVMEEGCIPWCHMDRPGPVEHRGNPTSLKIPKGHAAVLQDVQIEAAPKSPRKAPKLQETSLQAHRSQKDKASTDCMVVYNRLRKYPRGATCDRLEQALGMSHQTTSARLNDLARRGKIVDSGRREKTRTGRPAICWKAVV